MIHCSALQPIIYQTRVCKRPKYVNLIMFEAFKMCHFFRFKKCIEDSKAELFELGFPKFTTEDFHEMVSAYVKNLLYY